MHSFAYTNFQLTMKCVIYSDNIYSDNSYNSIDRDQTIDNRDHTIDNRDQTIDNRDQTIDNSYNRQ